jgi:hypothetical protein
MTGDSSLANERRGDDPLRAYEAAILDGITTLTASMRRGATLARRMAETGDDPAPRAEAIAEFRSWRAILDHLPDEPPPVYAPVHARVLRWAAVVAEVGDRHLAAIATGRPEDFASAAQQSPRIMDAYRDVMAAMERLAAAHRGRASD